MMNSTQNAKVANTRNGWAIALITSTYRNGTACYEITRVSPSNSYVTIHRTADYQKARKLANREWAADKA
jgi:hypothetical protein